MNDYSISYMANLKASKGPKSPIAFCEVRSALVTPFLLTYLGIRNILGQIRIRVSGASIRVLEAIQFPQTIRAIDRPGSDRALPKNFKSLLRVKVLTTSCGSIHPLLAVATPNFIHPR